MNSRIYQREGRVVHFQWTEHDAKLWRSLLEGIKAIPGRRWVPEAKYWEAPWDQHACQVIQELGFLPGEVKASTVVNLEAVSEEVKREIRAKKDAARKKEVLEELAKPWIPPWQGIEIDESRLPGRRPYQIESMRFLKQRNGRGLIGDDMGTGKTCQALSWLELNPAMRPAVVVCPAAVKWQWLSQARMWMSKNGSPVEILSGRTVPRWKPLSGNRIYVVNWDILSSWADWLEEQSPKIIIGDECQAISNLSSGRTKAFLKLAKPLDRHVIPMSGTPITRCPEQFFPVLNLLDPETFPKLKPYQWHFCGAHKTAFRFDATGASNVEELHLKIRPLMIRRTKKEVAPELPEKIRTPILLECVKDAEYEAIEDRVLQLQGFSNIELKQGLEELSRSAFALKRKAVLDWVSDFLQESDEKLIIFAWHRLVVDSLVQTFGRQCIAIHGGVPAVQRPGLVARFQQDPSCRICVANIVSGGTGVDGLQDVCSSVAFVELTTVPGHVMQAEDRAHRIGQRNCVNAWYLLGAGTIDEDMLDVLEERRITFGTIMDGMAAAEQDDARLVLGRLKKRKGLL